LYKTIRFWRITCRRTYLVVRLDDVVMVEEDDDEVKVVVGTDEVELLKEELESVELELL
jgi:DNA-binding LytR/AlgR family response regulator